MSMNGIGYGCQILDTMTSDVYCHILKTTLKDSLEWWGMGYEDIVFQQDNDPKHTSYMTEKWLSNHGVTVLDWPAQSPDLNPIEHLWHSLKLKLSKYETKAESIGILWSRVEKEWNSFSAEDCNRYIESMPDRVKAVLKAKGGSTRY
jgi:hypothetical protein